MCVPITRACVAFGSAADRWNRLARSFGLVVKTKSQLGLCPLETGGTQDRVGLLDGAGANGNQLQLWGDDRRSLFLDPRGRVPVGDRDQRSAGD